MPRWLAAIWQLQKNKFFDIYNFMLDVLSFSCLKLQDKNENKGEMYNDW